MDQPRMYFGHPVNTYNTPLEHALMGIIAARFPAYTIENPNQPHHQAGYQEWKAKTGNGMRYIFKKVLPQTAAGIFLPFEDGLWGAEVFDAALFLHENGKPTYEITWNGALIRPLTLDPELRLSIDATRQRVYGPRA